MIKLVRIDLKKEEIRTETLPKDWECIGGRALCAKIIDQEVPSNTDPLNPESKLVIAAGPLAGTRAPSCGRLSIGAKSPLTFGIKEANTGGPVAQKLPLEHMV